jgi:tetraacyldisaccharide 4'-kinase
MMFRNWLFECGCLPSRTFELPVISIGNISCGGTGKTPQIEYLIRLLHQRFFLATLSRGYGRKSKGFLLASPKSAYHYIGDEPLQFTRKFDDIKVAVDECRVRGIEQLLSRFPTLDVILLDDAFQHRYVKPGLSILLTDFHNLYADDYVLPSGTLREFRSGAKRADLIIVTKTPKILSPLTRRRITDELKPGFHQKALFSYIHYGEPLPFTSGFKDTSPFRSTVIMLFTGIANDYPLREHLERKCQELVCMKFPDHHPYTMNDLYRIKKEFDDIPTRKKVILTTEKDIMRLRAPELCNFLKNLPLFYIPIEIDFHGDDKDLFDKTVLNYVAENT